MNTELLDKIIIGRVVPHIYAFRTNTIPNYLKVGDTFRPVDERLNEWKRHFPGLERVYSKKSTIDENNYFRDYSLHKFLIEKKGEGIRLLATSPDFPVGSYYSNEFFKQITTDDLDDGIDAIKNDFFNGGLHYDFYDLTKMQPRESVYIRNNSFEPRPNQKATIKNFKNAIKNKRHNLLMYAVMRFGKSFTSMCCAIEMKARFVVIVSAKADVEREWKKTIESHVKFSDFVFINSKKLKRDNNAISYELNNGKKVAVFLTLQDLNGAKIKEKHKELFDNKKPIDLLIVDETHFGARAEEYGRVLKEYEKDVVVPEYNNEEMTYKEAAEMYKALERKVTLHLSGTPYRLLMNSEFSKEDIVCFCSFSDIIDEQEKWNKKWLLRDTYCDPDCKNFGKNVGDEVHEWDNPYFGFPKMIRFAFNPNASTQAKLNELQKNGYTYAFSKLFRPRSIIKTEDGLHKKFEHETEILDLFKAIDGYKEDENIFPFLNYDRIVNGSMCRHMVIVLPFCASCDALEELLSTNKQDFLRLCDYEIVNISGVDNPKKYKTSEDVIKKIEECEKNDIKTITLTVQRMLTGSTVKEWDTMIFLKDTASPQEYDQAIFRLQNQYVKTALDGTGKEIKIDMKPQTLLVDFAPNRMFYMQEKKAQIYNANVDKSGNHKLKERIIRELEISPIILMNKNKMEMVDEINILEAISNYNFDRGISEEVKDVSIDLAILNNPLLLNVIEAENEIDSKAGLSTKAGKGTGGDINVPDSNPKPSKNQATTTIEDEEKPSYIKKIQNYYRRLLFFAFLTDDIVSSLADIINVSNKHQNKRILSNIGVDVKELIELSKSFENKFALSSLDYKIQDLNKLAHNQNMTKEEKIGLALSKFGKLGESVVITSQNICDDMFSLVPDSDFVDFINNGDLFLDIASVSGEFAISFVNKAKRMNIPFENYRDKFFSIPKTSLCYELTRNVYEYLGLNTKCISNKINSYELIKNDAVYSKKKPRMLIKELFAEEYSNIKKEDRKMIRFGAIVGNPPYHENVSKASGNKSLGKELFPKFIVLSTKLTSKYVSLITPSKWFTSDGQDQSFPPLRKYIKENNHLKTIVNYTSNAEIFPDVNLGSVNYFLYDVDHNTGMTDFYENGTNNFVSRPLFEHGLDIIFSMNSMSSIVNKVIRHEGFSSLKGLATGRNAFGVSGKENEVQTNTQPNYFEGSVEVRCAHEVIRYIDRRSIAKNVKTMNSYKIFISKGNGASGTLDYNKPNYIIGRAYVGGPGSVCTDSLIPIGCFDTEEEALNLQKYMKTKFLRYLVGVMKTSRNIYQVVYELVPVQDFTNNSDINWNTTIEELDIQLFDKYGFTQEERKLIERLIKKMD